MQSLVAAVAALAAARHLDDVTRIVRQAARALTHADGVTFVLREGTDCYDADEKAIAPLWEGKRFPMDSRISGHAYRPTFIKSVLTMRIAMLAGLH